MRNKIISKTGKYFLAILITLSLWNIGATLLSVKDTCLNIIGSIIYFAIFSAWVTLLCDEFSSKSKNKDNNNTDNNKN
jgi:hypothetical protein